MPIEFENGQTYDGSAYSDTLFFSAPQHYNRLSVAHFGSTGQHFSNRMPAKIEAFLRDYFDMPKLSLCKVEKETDKATGFPVWRFDFLKNKT